MKKVLILSVLAFVFLSYCVQQVQEKKTKITDMAGREISIEKLERIVALNSESLEMLYLLGESGKVVGVGSWSKQDPILSKVFNFSGVFDVGTASRPNVEAIISLNPDLVITYYCGGTQYGYETPKEIVEKLESAGIPVFGICIAVVKPADWGQYYEMIEKLGKLLKEEERAKKIEMKLRSIFDEFQKNVSRVERKVRVVYSWNEMNRIAGNSTIMNVLIEIARGENIGKDVPEPYATVNPEFIVERNPEIWIIWKAAKYNSSDVLKDQRFKDVNAIKNGKVFKEPDLGSNWHPVRAHLYLLWHGKIYYGIPDFDLKAKEICKYFYGIECLWS